MMKKSDRKFLHKPSKTGFLSSNFYLAEFSLKNDAERTSLFFSTIFLDHIREGFPVFLHFFSRVFGHFTPVRPLDSLFL